jgi:hypothetical protein
MTPEARRGLRILGDGAFAAARYAWRLACWLSEKAERLRDA